MNISLIAKMTTICALIVVSFIHLFHIFKRMFKITFFNSETHEEVYIIPIQGVSNNFVLCIKKSLHGLTKNPRVVFEFFFTLITSPDFYLLIMILDCLSCPLLMVTQ